MLELRPCCELCGKDLPPAADEARICSFECTFCADCAERVLSNVCPNCGGGLWPRPVRPRAKLEQYPPAKQRKVKPLDADRHAALLARYRDLPPTERRQVPARDRRSPPAARERPLTALRGPVAGVRPDLQRSVRSLSLDLRARA